MALSSRVRRWWRHPRQTDPGGGDYTGGRQDQPQTAGSSGGRSLGPEFSVSRRPTSGGGSSAHVGRQGASSGRVGASQSPGGDAGTDAASTWRRTAGGFTPTDQPHSSHYGNQGASAGGGQGTSGGGLAGPEAEVTAPWRKDTGSSVSGSSTSSRGVTTDRLSPLETGQGHLGGHDLEPSNTSSPPPPTWTPSDLQQTRVNSTVTGVTSGVTPDPGGGHGVNRNDLDLDLTSPSPWSVEGDYRQNSTSSTNRWTDLLTNHPEPTNQNATSVLFTSPSSSPPAKTNSTSVSQDHVTTSGLSDWWNNATEQVSTTGGYGGPNGTYGEGSGSYGSSNGSYVAPNGTYSSGGLFTNSTASWTNSTSPWGGVGLNNVTDGNYSSDVTASPSSSTAFPGYLDLRDLTWDLSDYPDSMYGNYTGDCGGGAGWGANLTGGFPCWGAGGTSNATNTTWGAGGSAEGSLPPRYWALLLVVFPAFTLVGNVLVVTSVYRERALRTVTNYFIVSLAIADIAVALFVMPLAIYTEVNNGTWRLGDVLCDAWVALDVMGCTSSILNLTAISVDRFIAVTQPIRYAKHKHSKRVHIMLALTWIVSIAISSPIALGMNYTEARSQTPELCIFYNSEFLICSSMGSFYIPCIIMLVLYWRIFRSIHQRAKKQALKMTKHLGNDRNMKNVIENKAQVSAVDEHALTQAQERRRKCPIHGSPDRGRSLASHHQSNNHETSFTNVVTTTDTGEDDSHCAGDVIKSPLSDDTDNVIPNDKSTEFMLSPQSEDSHGEYRDGGDTSGYSPPVAIVVETQFAGNVTSPTSPKTLLSPVAPRGKTTVLGFRNHSACRLNFMKREHKESPRKSVTKFNFHLRHSKKKKQSTAIRRERKATKTLAIVLGVFLFCWLPFFTVNVMNAICIKLDVMHKPECNIDNTLMSFFVWLGYINSFLNPVIYTIFNIEFRKAFKNILVNPLGRRL